LHRIGLLLVGLIFFISGALALVYEVTWARMLAREFGSDAVAIAIVVAIFMLGLGLGARLAGIWGDALRNPLKVYGLLEAGLSLYVLASPWLIGYFTTFLGLLGHAAIENVWLLNSARTMLGMLVLLPPTLLMGAGLPLIVRFAADVASKAPSAIIALYAVNIIGAVLGVLAAGFWLLPAMGMTRVLTLAALGNLALALVVLLMSRHTHGASESRLNTTVGASSSSDSASVGVSLPLAALIVGLASMLCQLAWTRVIVLIVGGSAYAFSSILAVFLAGLGLGAWLVAIALRWFGGRAVPAFIIAGLLSVVTVFASTAVLPLLPEIFLERFDADLAATRLGVLNLQFIVASALFLLPATCMGMLFPLILRIALGGLKTPARDTGRVYLANTFGCVAGALLAGFVLIPVLGILPTLLVAVGLLCYSILLVHSKLPRPRFQVALAVLVMSAYGAGWFMVPPWNAQLMASGISEYARGYQPFAGPELVERLAQRSELLYYRDGRTATVTVSRSFTTARGDLYIATNGKVDGSSYVDMPTQKLSAHLPLLLHNNPRNMAVIGLGTGVTAGSATLHEELERVVVLEIEPAMVEGSKLFAPFNQAVHDHPKADIRVTDGRLHLILAADSYDVVTTEPSNPWIAGIASLYTEEFYRLGAAALREGGVYAQWLQIYNMSPENVRSVIKTFSRVFPYTYIAVTIVDTDLLLIGSKQPIELDLDAMASRISRNSVSADLADPAVGIHSIEELLARIWLIPDDIPDLVADARLHRDDWPFLMYEAPLHRFVGNRQLNMEMIAGAASGLTGLVEDASGDPEEKNLEAMHQAYSHYVPERYWWWNSQ